MVDDALLHGFTGTLNISVSTLVSRRRPRGATISVRRGCRGLDSERRRVMGRAVSTFLFRRDRITVTNWMPCESGISIQCFFTFFATSVKLSRDQCRGITGSPRGYNLSTVYGDLSG